MLRTNLSYYPLIQYTNIVKSRVIANTKKKKRHARNLMQRVTRMTQSRDPKSEIPTKCTRHVIDSKGLRSKMKDYKTRKD